MAEAGSNLGSSGNRSGLENLSPLKVFALIAAVTFIFRIFYANHLYQDDGLWFTTAQEITRGKALYREIYFDKPPLLPLTYAALFKVFGAHILTIRLFTIVYSVGISGLLYGFGGWLYGRREAILAGAMFAVFSTTFTTGHMQGLNTDFLMVLPYTAGALMFLRAGGHVFGKPATRVAASRLAFGAGAAVAFAVQTNPKAMFDLAFFAVFLLACRYRLIPPAEPGQSTSSRLSVLTGAMLLGLTAGSLPFVLYLIKTGSLAHYWAYVWEWGARYARYYTLGDSVKSAAFQTLEYFALNPILLVGLILMVLDVTNRRVQEDGYPDGLHRRRADVALLVWLAASYAGLASGGRFFGHYFFQLLPSLCLLSGRGIGAAIAAISQKRPQTRRLLAAGLAAAFLFTLVRFHARTAVLALDKVRGTKSLSTAAWFHDRLNEEERLVAAAVTERDDSGNVSKTTMSLGRHRPEEYLFVWGYRPEIYFWSGLLPASRFLSSQPLTGVPADVHYFGDDYLPLLSDSEASQYRAQLARDLESTSPKYIIDELGFFNAALAIQNYSELSGVIARYKRAAVVGRFFVYIRRDLTRRYLRKHEGIQSQ